MKVPQISVLRHGESTTFSCNLTSKQDARTRLKRISWYKDGILLESIRNPDPDMPLDTLRPIVLKNISVRDGGKYTCFLEVVLRNIREYNVSGSTMVESKCTVDWSWWRVSPWLQFSHLSYFSPTNWTFHKRDVCPSMTEFPYWWRKVGLESVYEFWLVVEVFTSVCTCT